MRRDINLLAISDAAEHHLEQTKDLVLGLVFVKAYEEFIFNCQALRTRSSSSLEASEREL